MAKKVKEIISLTGKLIIVQREKSSLNGNPRYMCMINETPFFTRPDSSYGYMITNHEGKEISVICSYYRGKLSLDKIA
jgi:hypothetical protein